MTKWRDTEKKAPDEVEDREIHIMRDYARDNPCTFCTDSMNMHSAVKQLNLVIDNDIVNIAFCDYHETELLSRLLNNWVRRKNRRKKPWPIPKEELCFLCGDILNDATEPEEAEDATD